MVGAVAGVHETQITDTVFLDLLHFRHGLLHVLLSTVLAAPTCQAIVIHGDGRTVAVVVTKVIVTPTSRLTDHTHTSAHAVHIDAHVLQGIIVGLLHLGEFLTHIGLTFCRCLAQGINLTVSTGRIFNAATGASAVVVVVVVVGHRPRRHGRRRCHRTRRYGRNLEVVMTVSTATHTHLRGTAGTTGTIGTTFRGRPHRRRGYWWWLGIIIIIIGIHTILFECQGGCLGGARRIHITVFVNRHGRLVGSIPSMGRGIGRFGARKDHGQATRLVHGPTGRSIAANAGIVGIFLLGPDGNDRFVSVVVWLLTKTATRRFALDRNLGRLRLRKTVQIGQTGAHGQNRSRSHGKG